MVKLFKMVRDGRVVAEVVRLSNGKVVVSWLGPFQSTVIWDSTAAFNTISVTPETILERLDPDNDTY
jgi:hypothetical protein